MEELARVAALLAAAVMFSLGLDLTPSDFSLIFRRPRALLLGLFNQFLILPGLTLLLCWFWKLEPALVLGFMVLAACPGSTPSNLMTQLARGNRALSVSLTGLTSALSFITIPAAIAVASAMSDTERIFALPIATQASKILLLCGVPLALGMLVRSRRPNLAKSLARFFPPLCLLAVVGIVAATIWLQRQQISAAIAVVGSLALLLNLLTLAISFALARLAGLDRASVTALGLECSMHNDAMGVYVCVTMLSSSSSVYPTLAYTFIMWATALPVVLGIRAATRAATRSPNDDLSPVLGLPVPAELK